VISLNKTLYLLTLFVLLIGCDDNIQKENQKEYIESSAVDPKKLGIYTQLSEIEQDLDGNGTNEVISVYIGSSSNNDEEQSAFTPDEVNYRLMVKDQKETYTLINSNKKIKNIREMWFETELHKTKIVVFFDGKFREIASFSYDSKNSRFIKELQYMNTGNIKDIQQQFYPIK